MHALFTTIVVVPCCVSTTQSKTSPTFCALFDEQRHTMHKHGQVDQDQQAGRQIRKAPDVPPGLRVVFVHGWTGLVPPFVLDRHPNDGKGTGQERPDGKRMKRRFEQAVGARKTILAVCQVLF
jgi:hypothetical protein